MNREDLKNLLEELEQMIRKEDWYVRYTLSFDWDEKDVEFVSLKEKYYEYTFSWDREDGEFSINLRTSDIDGYDIAKIINKESVELELVPYSLEIKIGPYENGKAVLGVYIKLKNGFPHATVREYIIRNKEYEKFATKIKKIKNGVVDILVKTFGTYGLKIEDYRRGFKLAYWDL